jgi:DNA-binding transcriptional ArsR family regulator
MLLTRAEELSGLAEWVYRTNETLSTENRQRNRLVLVGFHYALTPERSFPSFPAYIDHLEAMDPVKLRDKMMEAYSKLGIHHLEEGASGLNEEEALQNVKSYLKFLSERFPEELVDRELESLAYTYVIDPPKMQSVIVAHLRDMWHAYLKAEWERVRPMVQAAVEAFQQIDYSQMDKLEAARSIVGQGMEEKHWIDEIERAEQLLFVPNPHIGPYIGMFMRGEVLGIIFGARLPSGVQMDVPDLSINEILVRLGALADDTRLRILKFAAENDELRSQEIMDRLELSQSASSRHLKQLSATGYLKERRCAGAKCYSLNPERGQDTLQAVENFLLGP